MCYLTMWGKCTKVPPFCPGWAASHAHRRWTPWFSIVFSRYDIYVFSFALQAMSNGRHHPYSHPDSRYSYNNKYNIHTLVRSCFLFYFFSRRSVCNHTCAHSVARAASGVLNPPASLKTAKAVEGTQAWVGLNHVFCTVSLVYTVGLRGQLAVYTEPPWYKRYDNIQQQCCKVYSQVTQSSGLYTSRIPQSLAGWQVTPRVDRSLLLEG